MLFVRERRRSRRTPKRDPQRAERAIRPRIARRRAEEERADMLFVRERRRSRRTPKRDPQRAERAIGPRIARRRAEEERADMLFVRGDDEVGGLQSAIRSERSEQLDMVGLAGCDRTGPPAALQCGEGHGGCVLLGFLLVPTSTRSIALIVDLDHGLERLGVVRS